MKFAFLVLYELRCLKKIENLFKYVIDYYNADIIICCQELENTDEKVKLFEKNKIFQKIYKKKDPKEYFQNSLLYDYKGANWNNEACLQIYINWNEAANVLENYKDKYDYFILLRTDIDILFPFPEKEMFENISKRIYSFDANYARYWGNYSSGVFIYKDYIIQYLRKTFDVLKSDELIQNFLNSNAPYLNEEHFCQYCMNYNNLQFKYIKNINFFFISDNANSRTTWSTPTKDEKYDGFIKYPQQVNEVFDNLNLWNQGYQWKYENDCFFLSL